MKHIVENLSDFEYSGSDLAESGSSSSDEESDSAIEPLDERLDEQQPGLEEIKIDSEPENEPTEAEVFPGVVDADVWEEVP